MGGFTVNGCGTGDSFYPKLNLGNHFCKACNSIQEFDLMEVKRKVKVLYIPTFSLKTEFVKGVLCKSYKLFKIICTVVKQSSFQRTKVALSLYYYFDAGFERNNNYLQTSKFLK